MRLRVWIVVLAAVAVIAAGVAAWASTAGGRGPRPMPGPTAAARTRAPAPPSRPRSWASPSASPAIDVVGTPGKVKAKGAVLADAATGQVLWGRDVSTERPMASVTKVMTALLVLEGGDLGRQILMI